MTEQLSRVAAAVAAAGHGEKCAIYDRACADLGISRATLLRALRQVSVRPQRKQRADAGTTALTREDAVAISAVLQETMRKNGKRLLAFGDAVEMLRANGLIRAEALDEQTGELRPLSVSAIARALRGYGLHPDQVTAPAPVTELASEHPNHVWEIDASLCVLYYLKPAKDIANGLQVMDSAQFYKNKPKNLARVAADRVWSYEITDHTSGWIYVEYVMGAESAENLCSVLINCMQDRGGHDCLHGVPRVLFMDPGSAGMAGMTRNLCRSLGIEIIAHKAGNARATGQVEKARDIIERKFEPGLKFVNVADLAELNALAARWRAHFNATAQHRRTGVSRTDAWLRITAEQLVKAPPAEVCRELAVATPEQRKVSPKLRVSFRGDEFDVSQVPGVMVGEKLSITRNPWADDAAQAVAIGTDGQEVRYVIPRVERDEWGFAEGAARIGESFKAQAQTPAQKAAAEVEQLVTGTDSAAAAEAVRKARALPFGGRINPYQEIDDAELPTLLPRRGQQHALQGPRLELPKLTPAEAARKLKRMVEAAGGEWGGEQFRWLQQRYADGVPEEAIASIVDDIVGRKASPLRVVAGGA